MGRAPSARSPATNRALHGSIAWLLALVILVLNYALVAGALLAVYPTAALLALPALRIKLGSWTSAHLCGCLRAAPGPRKTRWRATIKDHVHMRCAAGVHPPSSGRCHRVVSD